MQSVLTPLPPSVICIFYDLKPHAAQKFMTFTIPNVLIGVPQMVANSGVKQINPHYYNMHSYRAYKSNFPSCNYVQKLFLKMLQPGMQLQSTSQLDNVTILININ